MPWDAPTELFEEKTKEKANYWRPSSIKSGSTSRFHILTTVPSWYWAMWAVDDKGGMRCFRFPYDSQPTDQDIEDALGENYRRKFDGDKPVPMKATCAFPIYNYSESRVEIAEIGQKQLNKDLVNLGKTEGYEDFDEWDFQVARNGTGLDTVYTLTGLPRKKGTEEDIESAYEYVNKCIDMEAYCNGSSPIKKA